MVVLAVVVVEIVLTVVEVEAVAVEPSKEKEILLFLKWVERFFLMLESDRLII